MIGAGHDRCGVVRDCPLGTGEDRYVWHGSGTGRRGPTWLRPVAMVASSGDGRGPCVITTSLVGNSRMACSSVLREPTQLMTMRRWAVGQTGRHRYQCLRASPVYSKTQNLGGLLATPSSR